MIRPDREIGERAYDEDHTQSVLSAISTNFERYFSAFAGQEDVKPLIANPNFKFIPSKKRPTVKAVLEEKFGKAIDDFMSEQPAYQRFFDLPTLEEYRDDPNTFKKDFAKKVPIMNRCLNSSASEMKRYKSEFAKKTGRELLNVCSHIIQFGADFMRTFNETGHEDAASVEELGLSQLLEEQYISYQVIGGGIKSNFLYFLYPNAFPNRSQDGIWALWYLTDKDSFGFADGSEFLMLDPPKSITQQNYHYPYDLFAFYGLEIYKMLKDASNRAGVTLLPKFRYIYLDAFLDSIARSKQSEINDLKKSSENEE